MTSGGPPLGSSSEVGPDSTTEDGEGTEGIIDLRVMLRRRKIQVNPEKFEVFQIVLGLGYIYVTQPAPWRVRP